MSTLLKIRVPHPEAIVQVSDSEGFAVRGLDPHQVFSLYHRHTGELSELFTRIMANVKDNGAAGQADIEAVMLTMIQEFPTLLSELIVLGSGGDTADEAGFDEALAVAKTLTFAVQVDALTKIGTLTFTSDMPPGKFLTLVVGLLQKVTGAMKQSFPAA